LALGYRMTGTLADAEDIVQETYLRWYRLTAAEREAIANPAGWLTTVAGRIALDLLGSARRRREQYVGPWLPEPVPADRFSGATASRTTASVDDPLDRITLDDEV
ncbi:RNA polymerase subunit sigma-24, partial [Pseudomonas sp. BGM005]|nr:RNA polymerase subunit sigma-24 [Pseudomonas sp. BG5]